jgi:hypothetical protein
LAVAADFFLVTFFIFVLVSLAKQVRQQKTPHPASFHRSTAKQQTQRSSLFAFTLRLVQNRFS